MNPPRCRSLARHGRRVAAYGLALCLPAAIAASQLRDHESTARLFMFFFAAVIATTVGGLGPGLLATAVGAVLGNLFFLGTTGELTLAGSAGRDTLLFVAAGLTVTLLQNALRRTTVSLQEAVRGRDQFMAVAGHELANPLSALELQVQAVRRRLLREGDFADPAGVDACRQRGLDQELATIARLRALVRELLDVSRIRSGTLQLRPDACCLAAIARAVCDRFEEAATQAGCRIDVVADMPVPGHWDALRIDQVVSNLLGNALKYGPGAPIEVAVAGDGAVATLTVADHGPGISPADQARIFTRFERLEAQRGAAGLGLGLWIVAQIVAASAGRIEVDSALGAGARFTVRLPQGPGPAAAARATAAAAAARP